MGTIAVVEHSSLTSLEELDPLNIYGGWSAVLSMLMLAFPEVHWIILSPCQPAEEFLRQYHFISTPNLFHELEYILKCHHEGFSSLFDPAGLRNQIRRRISARFETSYVPLRKECAASIDDEENYAFLNAYICYRFGFRCHVLTSYGIMSSVLTSLEEPLALSFEDLYLNFPDKRQRLSDISHRDATFPLLKNTERRIFVTGGHEGDTWDTNIKYLKQRWLDGMDPAYKPRLRFRWRRTFTPSDNPPTSNYTWLLYKPEAGVFDVWNRSGLEEQLENGRAEGFVWPPPMHDENENTSHSAPGRMLLVAQRMIVRAERILKSGESVSEAVYGATLALEAQEYLGYRTPTTSLDAVALKHQLEVLAECMFYGVEYNLDTKRRFAEIQRDVECVGKWFRSKTREISKGNAKLGIVSDLVTIYRSFNQFDEEQAGLARLRDLYRKLWFKRNKHWPWAWLMLTVRWYIDLLLNSIITFCFVIAGWLVLFSGIYALLPHGGVSRGFLSNLKHGIEDTIVTFFGLQPPHELFALDTHGRLIVSVTMILILIGFLHLGIFVSHLYAMMTRR
ncbi:MAG: hypothetical protein ACXW18_05635 [Pyrinomonadaceae bacterium]